MAHEGRKLAIQLEQASEVLAAQAKILRWEARNMKEIGVRDHKFTLLLAPEELLSLESLAVATGRSMASVLRLGMGEVALSMCSPDGPYDPEAGYPSTTGFFDEE